MWIVLTCVVKNRFLLKKAKKRWRWQVFASDNPFPCFSVHWNWLMSIVLAPCWTRWSCHALCVCVLSIFYCKRSRFTLACWGNGSFCWEEIIAEKEVIFHHSHQKKKQICSKTAKSYSLIWKHSDYTQQRATVSPECILRHLGMNPAKFGGLNVQVEATRTRRQKLCPLEHILQSNKRRTSTDQHLMPFTWSQCEATIQHSTTHKASQ